MKEQISLRPEQLKPNPFNTYVVEDIQDLKNSIATYGLITPLCVIGPFEDNCYSILSGERRYTACKALIEEGALPKDYEIPCLLYGSKEMNQTMQKLIIEISNLETRDFSRVEHMAIVMELLKEMVDNGDLSERKMASQAAKLFKVSPRWGRYWRRVFLSDNEELKDMVKEGKVKIQDASKIVSLDKDEQQKVMTAISDNTPAEEAIHEVKAAKETAKNDEWETIDPKKAASIFNEKNPSTDDYEENFDDYEEDFDDYEEDFGGYEDAYAPKKSDRDYDEEPSDYGEEPSDTYFSGTEELSFEEDEISAFDEPAEYSPKETFSYGEKIKGKSVEISQEELDRIVFDPSDFAEDMALDLDTTNRIGVLKQESEKKENAAYKAKLNEFLIWCNKIKNTEEPTDEEWNVIEACKEVADKFLP